MINSLYAENYKSFQKLHLDIDSVNILLGSNSCGKSSITNLLLMLSQTADTDSTYESIFRLNGSKSSLGEAVNIFPDKDPSKLIKIGWTVDNELTKESFNEFSVTDILSGIDDKLRTEFSMLRRFKENNEDIYDEYFNIVDGFGDVYFNELINQDSINRNHDELELLKSKTSKSIRLSRKKFEQIVDSIPNSRGLRAIKARQKSNISLSKLNDLFDHVNYSDRELDLPNAIEFTIGYNENKKECEVKSLSILTKDKREAITIQVSSSRKIELNSDIFDNYALEKSRLDIVRNMNLNNLSLLDYIPFRIDVTNPFSDFVRQYISSISNFFLEQLRDTKVNHVSPLRAFPQRYYLLEKSAQHTMLNSTDGSQLAEILKNNPAILKSVNSYFDEFGIKISTAKTNDIIHRITVKQDNVTVELTDVGFGISQVLPILVQALLSPPNSITIIEQPEIHLHPKMQAWLTSVLVNLAITKNKKFIIETHSDTIIKRLQLLLLEPIIEFNISKLNIYHLERNNAGNTTLKKAPLNEFGEISWPKGFMDSEINDAIKLQKLKVNALKIKRVS